MSKWVVDIHGDIEGDYEIIKKYEEPKTGHWIKNAEEYQRIDPPYICDKCGNASLRATPYCEQCGAWMESEEQDADSD